MHSPGICEHTDLVCIHTGEYIFVLAVCCLLIPLIRRLVNGPGISETVHKENNLHLLDFLFLIYGFGSIFNRCDTFSPEFFFYSFQLINDDCCHGIIVVENILIAGNIFQSCLMLCHKRLDLQANEFIEAHIQYGRGLPLCELQLFGLAFAGLCLKPDSLCNAAYQTIFHLLPVLAASEDLNDKINDITGFYQAFLDLLFFPLFR